MRRTFGDAFDFVIVRKIASGGMGAVYEALQCGVRGFSKRVALKVMRPEVSDRPELRELFVAEAHLVADLVHENIVQIYHLGEVPAESAEEPPPPGANIDAIIAAAGEASITARGPDDGTKIDVLTTAALALRDAEETGVPPGGGTERMAGPPPGALAATRGGPAAGSSATPQAPAAAEPRLYFSMELIDGVPLDAALDRHRSRGSSFPVDLAAFIASRIARALEYAHTRTDAWGTPLGIVHRDVCPANVLLARGGVVKLSDFGVAKARYRTGAMDLTSDGEGEVLVGRARYMSPEAARLEQTDARSDVYSLGVLLHEMLAGPAFHSAFGDGRRHRTLLPIELLRKDIPERLAGIVGRALQRDPAQRYPSAGALGLDLERFVYEKGYGPTNLTLAEHVIALFPDPDEARDERGADSLAGARPPRGGAP